MKRCIFLIVCLSQFLSACGLSNTQKNHIKDFGKATELVSSTTQIQFVSYKEKLDELEKRRVVMSKTSLDGVLKEAEAHNDEKFLKLVNGIEALKSYGAALVSLSANDQSEAISKSTNNLVSQFESFKKHQGKTLDDKKKKAATEAINSIGGMIVAHKKKQAIEKLILEYSDDVDEVAEFLLYQFKIQTDKCKTQTENKIIKASMTDTYCFISNNTEFDADDQIANACDASSVAYAKETKYMVIQDRKRVVALAKENVKVMEKFAKANKALIEVVRNDKYEALEIQDYLKQVYDLDANLKVLF